MRNRIRSPALLATSLALLAASAALGYVLQHDAVGEVPAFASVGTGQDVTVKGTAQPFVPRSASAQESARWVEVQRSLSNATVQVDTGDAGTVVLLTGLAAPATPGTEVVASGPIVLRTAHPDGSHRTLLVVRSPSAESPILFG